MHEPITSVQLSKLIIYGCFAIMGGIVHALIAQRKGTAKGFADLLALTFISGFAGAMWILVAINFQPDNQIIHLFAGGMGGYLSTEGLAMLVNNIRDYIQFKNKK
jgi:hypothetical protein